jgi:hypothetical protein
LKIENHYVPCVYLKNFANSEGKVAVYKLLVSHQNVRQWRFSSPRGITYLSHLYTRIISGTETDEIETWLSENFEASAEEAIYRAVHDKALKEAHWQALIRFTAAQHVRTPARLLERMRFWQNAMPFVLDEALKDAVKKWSDSKKSGAAVAPISAPNSEYIPLNVRTEATTGHSMGTLMVETVIGRGLWLFTVKHLLTTTLNVLLNHRWTVLRPFSGMAWFTSDDPVITLNYNGPNNYDFRGGWGSKGSEILLPLGPKHLLYTQIGRRPPRRGSMFSHTQTSILQQIIAEHAFRMIIATEPIDKIPEIRPRTVDAQAERSEREQWRRWHQEQAAAERQLRTRTHD